MFRPIGNTVYFRYDLGSEFDSKFIPNGNAKHVKTFFHLCLFNWMESDFKAEAFSTFFKFSVY